MRDWLLANLFLLAVVLIGAAYMFGVGLIYRTLDENGFNAWVTLACSAVATVGTYYAARGLHTLVGRWINGAKSAR